MVVSWSNLPADLVCAIGKRFQQYEEYDLLRKVCVSWRSALPAERPYFHDHQIKIPWLILPLDDRNKRYNGYYSFFDKKLHSLDLKVINKGKLCRGSSGGWLVMVKVGSPELSLFNPLTKAEVALPPISTLPDVIDYDVNRRGKEYRMMGEWGADPIYHLDETLFQQHMLKKIVISSTTSPNNNNNSSRNRDDLVVMAIYDHRIGRGHTGQLTFCKPCDKQWTKIPEAALIQDAVPYDGKLYALTTGGMLVVGDIGSLPKMDLIRVEGRDIEIGRNTYLVASSTHGVLMIQRGDDTSEDYVSRTKTLPYWTTEFKIFKLVPLKNGPDCYGYAHDWLEVMRLDDSVLFLGINTSFIAPAQSTPQLQGNQIYFTDDYLEGHDVAGGVGGFDFGMFNMKTKTLHAIPGYKYQKRILKSLGYKAHQKKLVWPPPVWMVPNQC